MYLECIVTSGYFETVARPLEFLLNVKVRSPPLEVRRGGSDSFPDKAGKPTLLLGEGGKTWALLELWWDHWCSSQVESGMSGKFLSCLKSVKDPPEAQERRREFSQDTTAEKGLISC